MTLNSFVKERYGNEKKLLVLDQSKPVIPSWLIWIQCIAFVVLYAVWILPEIVGFRNTALVVGALAGLYPIYKYRAALWTKRAVPIWLIVALFAWATFHLLFLSHDYAAQLLEYKRIWKYAAIGAVFAFGLGLSLIDTKPQKYWSAVYFGLMLPTLIYLVKYLFTALGIGFGAKFTAYATLAAGSVWISKYNYVAFCLPALAIAFGRIRTSVNFNNNSSLKNISSITGNAALISAILFLFYNQDIRNGIAYSLIVFGLFVASMFLYGKNNKKSIGRLFLLLGFSIIIFLSFYQQILKNPQWASFIHDAQLAYQTDNYSQWKFAGEQGYPTKNGRDVAVGNYERVAWAKVGAQLSLQNPLGYGLIEDSFKKLAKIKWPEVSLKLSHSHSGWLDLILAMGYPGFICIFGALIYLLWQSQLMTQPWKDLVLWGLSINIFFWFTTEVCTNITFVALIFWVALASGLSIRGYTSVTPVKQ